MKERVASERISTEKAMLRMASRALAQGKSLALWRMPEQVEFNLASCAAVQRLEDVSLEELPAGFLVGPFDVAKEKFFFASDTLHQFNAGGWTGPESETTENLPDGTALNWHVKPSKKMPDTREDGFMSAVSAGIQSIESGTLEKVVPARIREVELPGTATPLDVFFSLAQRYPNALVSLISSPQTGTWLGATPELLVSLGRDGIFQTVALAGTQPYVAGADLKRISWTQKDIEEQALVGRYIINCFKKIRLREYEEHGPKTCRAGNLLHLKTDYVVDTRSVHFPQLASVMLKLLHPTSAVCGMPLEAARNFLNEHEKHDRELYSGFLGPVNEAGETHLFVNLRCMQWLNGRARLYAGAGVTADSDPAAEWRETEMKLNTILKAISA